jgi:hypothetical protein
MHPRVWPSDRCTGPLDHQGALPLSPAPSGDALVRRQCLSAWAPSNSGDLEGAASSDTYPGRVVPNHAFPDTYPEHEPDTRSSPRNERRLPARGGQRLRPALPNGR